MSPSRSGQPSLALAELSSELAGAVASAGQSVVAIHARRRIPSSGIVWRDGVVVSASHTVRQDDEIRVVLPSGDAAVATVAGRDPATDVVALRLRDATPPAADRAGGDAVRVGSLVLAVGRPGAQVTASFGIVSAVADDWRTWQGTRIERVLRLDLAIYDGFSGGPLVGGDGRVLGLNNSALARGTPVALTAATVDRLLDDLLERGHVRRPFIGVAVHPVALGAALRERQGLDQQTALVVLSVAEGAPADAAGVIVGDTLLTANGQRLERATDLLDALSDDAGRGATLRVQLLRAGAVQELSITPADRPHGRAR